MPVSIAVRGNLVYVLNAGGTPDISGFTIRYHRLVHIPGSTRRLGGGTGSAPAEVKFTPDGDVLMVTEKNTNLIDTWTVNRYGYASNHQTAESHGATPFGFSFTRGDDAIVSEAGPSALSSYEVDDDGHVGLLSGTVKDGGKANCWVVVTHSHRGHRYAFAADSASGNISSYTVAGNGHLELLEAKAAIPGGVPLDEALTRHGRFLYVRNANGTVDGFRIEHDGSLEPVVTASGLPAGAQGIAAR